MKLPQFLAAIVLLLVTSWTAATLDGQSAINSYDPVTMDPAVHDAVNPPQLAEIDIQSEGQRLNALLYVAAGRGPNPTVILLHGIPGNERNLDLAQVLRRAGANVLYFNYRGTWGSGGLFSRANTLKDVAAALRYLRSPATVGRYHIDTRRIALIGHSFGGWVALMGAAADEEVACVVGLDVANVGARSRRLLSDAQRVSTATTNSEALIAPGAPYRAESAAGLVAEMKAHADEWDLIGHAANLRRRPILLISAVNPGDQKDLIAALASVNAQLVSSFGWETDHSFSDRRIELARTVVKWLSSACAF